MAATEVEQKHEVTEETLSTLAPELLIKHKLHNSWTLWYFEKLKGVNWEDCQVEVVTFSTAEDFWAAFNHLECASNLPLGTDYSLFKTGIRPQWEDSCNKPGGRWLFTMEQTRGQAQEKLDVCWLNLMLLMIGEQFGDFGDIVNGAVVNKRPKADKIALWTSNISDREANLHVGRKMKEAFSLPPNMLMGYNSHADSSTKNSSSAKCIFKV